MEALFEIVFEEGPWCLSSRETANSGVYEAISQLLAGAVGLCLVWLSKSSGGPGWLSPGRAGVCGAAAGPARGGGHTSRSSRTDQLPCSPGRRSKFGPPLCSHFHSCVCSHRPWAGSDGKTPHTSDFWDNSFLYSSSLRLLQFTVDHSHLLYLFPCKHKRSFSHKMALFQLLGVLI